MAQKNTPDTNSSIPQKSQTDSTNKVRQKKTEARRKAEAKEKAQILKARRDPAFFTEFVFPNEKTKKKIFNAEFHREWHEFLSNNRWGVLISPIGHGKTFQIGVARTIWEMGKNPNIRILLLGKTGPAAEKVLRIIKKHIERNPKLKKVFPNLKRSTYHSDPWTSKDITIERGESSAKEPTIQARGIGSEDVLGSRLDLIVLDDVLNLSNSGSPLMRDKLEEWFDSTCFSRIDDEYDVDGNLIGGGMCYAIGTPWHKDDLLHRLKRRPRWAFMRYSAVLNPREHYSKWVPLWPRVWPLQRILDRRDGGMPLATFAKILLTETSIDEMSRFKQKWLDDMFAAGRNRTLLDRTPYLSGGRKMRCITGVDFGIGKQKKDAKTVLFTIAIHPQNNKRIVVDVESGKWEGPEILSKIEEKNWRYESTVFVESNQAQKWMKQFATNKAIPTFALFTGAANKYHEEFGVESIAVEMRAGLWIAPSGKDGCDIDDELLAWREDMEDYDPELHTGDHLMASWIAREGARKHGRKRQQRSNHMHR